MIPNGTGSPNKPKATHRKKSIIHIWEPDYEVIEGNWEADIHAKQRTISVFSVWTLKNPHERGIPRQGTKLISLLPKNAKLLNI